MVNEESKAFRARLISINDNTVIMDVLNGELSNADQLVFCSSGETFRVIGLDTNVGSMSADLDSPVAVQIVAQVDAELDGSLGGNVAAKVGEIIARSDHRPDYVDQFEAEILWMSDQKMLPGRRYLLSCAGQMVDASVTKLKYRVEQSNGEHIAANSISKDQVFIGNLALSHSIAFDPMSSGLETSTFELKGSDSKTLARGQIRHGLRRASNVHWQAITVDKTARSRLKNQTPKIVWLTGLSASGKSTIANIIEKKLLEMGRHAYLLDGDNVRHGLNKDLGFTDADRVENIRRIAETSKLMLDAGLIVIASFISPFEAERRMARSLFEEGEFIEVHVNASLAVCEQRDPKGLYKKVRQGVIQNFTGFDSPYDRPENPEIKIESETVTAEEAATKIIDYLFAHE
jgi:bifunctional enzyme CysN/CysC